MASHARTLNDTEFESALETAGSIRNRLILQLTHFTGMRIGEVGQLKISDVVRKNGEIKDRIRLTPKQTKKNWGRDVFLSAKMRWVLASYIQTLGEYVMDRPLIASTKSGQRLTAQSLYNLCRSIYQRAGLDASSHSGRRTLINKMSGAGVPLRIIQAQCGHRQLSTTQLYLNAPDFEIQKAMEQI